MTAAAAAALDAERLTWLSAASNAAAGPQPMSDINMTPLIDVMLVLLVIFIITAPLMTSSLKLDLPKTDAAPSRPTRRPSSPWRSTRRARCSGATSRSTRRRSCRRAPRSRAAQPDHRGAAARRQAVPYGRVAELIGLVQDGGLSRIGFVTEPRAGTGPAPLGCNGPPLLQSRA